MVDATGRKLDRKDMPDGPRRFSMIGEISSGPSALELLLFLIACLFACFLGTWAFLLLDLMD